jgi:hypothetical protein
MTANDLVHSNHKYNALQLLFFGNNLFHVIVSSNALTSIDITNLFLFA